MEYLDLVNEEGEPTGIVKERSLVHRDGDWHRTSHVWIMRKTGEGKQEVLLQKRSKEKDSFPGCYDISSAGHIPAGKGYLESAVRELKEELGIDVKEDELEYRMTRKIENSNIFYGKEFVDRQVTRVYRLQCDGLQVEDLTLQEEEVESVLWMEYEECLKAVKENTMHHCIILEELEAVR